MLKVGFEEPRRSRQAIVTQRSVFNVFGLLMVMGMLFATLGQANAAHPADKGAQLRGDVRPTDVEELVERHRLPRIIEVVNAARADVLDINPLDATITVVGAGTNLRPGPGTVYPYLVKLDETIRLTPLGRHGEWVKVRAGDQEGWVITRLLDADKAIVEALPEITDIPAVPEWVWPAQGALTSPFGWRVEPFESFHNGLDLANDEGTQIVSAHAGMVIEAGWCAGYGYCVKIDHGEGLVGHYGHMLTAPVVRAGDQVVAGQPIGLMGNSYDAVGGGFSSGVHLHYSLLKDGQVIDPAIYLPENR